MEMPNPDDGVISRRREIATALREIVPGEGVIVELHLDASPWGLGAFLTMGGRLAAWFSVPLGDEELNILDVNRGDCKSQQVVEALCALVALRAWAPRWRGTRALLSIAASRALPPLGRPRLGPQAPPLF